MGAVLYNSAYPWPMTELTVSEARARLADAVDQARTSHEPVFLTRRGRRVAALVDASDLDDLLEMAEELEDLKAAAAARLEMAESGAQSIPWDQVKADLGLA